MVIGRHSTSGDVHLQDLQPTAGSEWSQGVFPEGGYVLYAQSYAAKACMRLDRHDGCGQIGISPKVVGVCERQMFEGVAILYGPEEG